MPPHTKARRHIGPVHRGPQQEAFDVLARFIEILDARGALEPVKPFSLDLRKLQVAGLHSATVLGDVAVKDQLKRVSGFEVTVKVDLVGEQLDHLGADSGVGPQLGHAFVERAMDFALRHRLFSADLLCQFAQSQGPIEGAR